MTSTPVDKRRGQPAVPSDLDSLLTERQTAALDQLKAFGWSVHVVRRPLFQTVQVILEHSSGKFARLTPEGELDHRPGLRLRREVRQPGHDEAWETSDPWAHVDDERDLVPLEKVQEKATVSKEPVPGRDGAGPKPRRKILV